MMVDLGFFSGMASARWLRRRISRWQRPRRQWVRRQWVRRQWGRLHRQWPLTRPGCGVAVCGVALMAVFPICGWLECLAAGMTLLSLTAGALLMTVGRLPLAAGLTVSSTRVAVGGRVTVGLEAGNPGRHPSSAAVCAIGMAGDWHQVHVPGLAAGGTHRVTRVIVAQRRGRLTVGPAAMIRGDPLGLAVRKRRLAPAVAVTVHPCIVTLPRPIPQSVSRAGNRGDGWTGRGEGMELRELREYGPGDDARRIHWPSSLRLGVPVLRVAEAGHDGALALALDTTSNHYASAEEFELAVSVYASLGVRWLRGGRPLHAAASPGAGLWRASRMAASPGVTSWEAGRTMAFLDACSVIVPADGVPATGPPPFAAQVLVVGSRREAVTCGDVPMLIQVRTGARTAVSGRAHGVLLTVGGLEELPKVLAGVLAVHGSRP